MNNPQPLTNARTRSNVQRPAPSSVLTANPVVAVMRARHAREYAPVIEALIRGGVRSIELTLSTDGVFQELPRLKERFGTDAEIGVGTITTADQARQALDGGADYLVTPAIVTAVVSAAVERGIPVLPGGLTPTELLAGWDAGATAVKLFPASAVGPGYLAQLRGPFPQMRIVPSGGIGIDDAPAWIAAGALAVSLGGPLLRDAFSGGNLADLTARAEKLSRLVAEAVEARAAK
ncbi:2-dehydro-3-deoxyphosphogluconate aldolase/(4S)-4-hydroxy-2-oxoglutarate aldolase [Paenarthrobacter nicotinovorans]|uniref:bifunctional 4-hydroxy-2-oxoglutarate aldolase/2-dehydro-3-deoxy-phosphogluconate aldolase n=1 Tax=Micrococcaceae TaxID=1268 RepID=UPI00087653F2|nr:MULTISPECIES: bifunctional 4-hydroxy-2-oxoglutarate aldolase/2-dehydro-3-deoxy-phosphogluconate aldolase [Micrococcaceae]MDR6438981.1 2-dehydro-3-deoxyphosphogluconate aldolase/(4S)-4-hydroxy-2-oxoglutarate aldolase [Paenarthrobacter nicotinovorans]SCZ63703.1 2-dehydro-3-deoxyphosphogluconate aldolase / (4S)-4-hydroxy-2-oxoglutarate aldolase [Arthrobacter sp. UNCCL28]